VLSQVIISVQEEPAATVAPMMGDSRFRALVEEHAPMVFRTLLRLLGRGEGLDDLAQDCFLRLYRALGQLSAIQRTILVLYHQEERTYEQIAAVLGMPIGTVRTHLHRGRARLRELIGSATGTGRDTGQEMGRGEAAL
jgi:DNA-directed RNA polymerase specialized sigma24 family protein